MPRQRNSYQYCVQIVSAASQTPRVLSIAGSDSGGGAGIQADLKAFARCGVHGMSAITAITAQNTLGVRAIHPIPPAIVLDQVTAVLEDIGVDAVKVGMLGDGATIRAVAQALDLLPAGTPVVVDPVMIAESGAQLLDPDARGALVSEILPRASVLTPNLPEARALAGHHATIGGEDPGEDAEIQARRLLEVVLALGPDVVVLTGGHRDQAVDLLLDSTAPGEIVSIPGERHQGGASHGSGCTHSSVLAAQLALGHTPQQAAQIARALAGAAVAGGLRDIGNGSGPVDVIGLSALRDAS